MDKIYLDLDYAIKSAFEDLELALNGNVDIAVPFLCGAPGGGKTSIVAAECKKRDWNLLVKNTAMMLYEELSGIPEIYKNTKGELCTQWSKPQLVSELEQLSSKPVVCFFDDWHRTNQSIQSLAFETFSGKIGGVHTLKGFPLPKNSMFLLAGNDSILAGSREQLSAVLNRVSKKYVKTNYNHWKTNFASGRVNPIILGFLDAPENSRFFHMAESEFEPWASPRSWTYLSTKMDVIENRKDPLDNTQLVAEFASYVGYEAASVLIQHWIYYKTVNVKEIFDKGIYKIPSDLVSRFIFSYAVSYEFIKRWNTPKKDSASAIFGKILVDIYKVSKESGAILISQVSQKYADITTELTKKGIISRAMLESLESLTSNMGRLEHG